ncbi:MAG: hypothetical protein Q8S84_01030 [bacterium]|nr:hypothetical protein [bacterium]MDP3380160.1 hypothetical protein [bacterium]
MYSENMDETKISNNVVIVNKIEHSILLGFDFIICDNEIEQLKNYLDK